AAVARMQAKKVQTAKGGTHIVGLNAAGETTRDLPAVGGGKKLGYTGKAFPLTPLGELADPELPAIVARHHGIWSQEA
ncbi:L-sorbose 1-phosphate reductase, partial [Klebsiella variicola]|nr:L-sorbose 1-phosphate reductase [Klebsiella variicola]